MFLSGVFSVATSPFETKTENRPFALMSPMKELKLELGLLVICTTNGSGVGLDVWATTGASEPPKNVSTMMAHKNQKTCFTDSSANIDTDPSRLDALGELSSVAQVKVLLPAPAIKERPF